MQLKRLLFLFLVCACQEEESILPSQPARFHKGGLQPPGTLRVFTVQGELTNPAIVTRFQAADSMFFNYTNRTLRDYGSIDSLQFTSTGNGRLFRYYQWNDYALSEQDNLLVLTRTLEDNYCCTQEPETESITYHIGKIKPVVASEYIYSSTGGNYLFGYVGQPRAVFQQTGDRWLYPILNYIIHTTTYTSYLWHNNVLEPHFYKHIPVGDTVSLQLSGLLFERDP